MELGLSGKVAIVTGASRGIGRAIAETLASEGMKLMLAARSADQLHSLVTTLPTECMAQAVDLCKPDAPSLLIENTVARFNRLDVLVNNAGATKRGDFLSLSEADWSDGFALKFFGAMRCCRAAWPHLVKSGGVIINIAGVGGRTGSAEFAIGGSVNAALLNLTKVLADRGIKDGVRVNAINPGSIATERLQTRIERLASERGIAQTEAAQSMAQALRVARFGSPYEIARAVAFLASPQSAYCQGAILDVDGGQTRTL
ncbi:MAG: SDR family oxidoreductase [Pyrinomonadaceae bacterium]|nr:SDR family oxidoreductase [Pyrinomonadaceae bacterium]